MSEQRSEHKFFFTTSISGEQSRDTGLAMVLIFLLLGYFTGNSLFYNLGIPLVLLIMIIPGCFYPFAIFWIGFSKLIGNLMSRIILIFVYFFIVLPVAIFRRLAGIDNLRLKQFKKDIKTTMHIRNHIYQPSDMEKPF
jgi:hypothetical protein